VCVSFPETLARIPKNKGILTGIPIRKELFGGKKGYGASFCGFTGDKPVLFVTGGGAGSRRINAVVREALPELLKGFDVAHACGKGNVDNDTYMDGYKQFEFLGNELPHIYACSDVVISRAGANTIYEILALRKPNLLIPLSRKASRGDQILNARSFEAQGFSEVLQEEELTAGKLAARVYSLHSNRAKYINAASARSPGQGCEEVLKVITKMS